MNQWLDRAGERLSQKSFTLPTTLAAGIIFLIFGIVMCLIFPSQIQISEKDIVNGRSFPYLLMGIMIACSIVLIIVEVRKILLKKPLETKQVNLLVEIKALIIFVILLLFYFIARYVGFLTGAILCAISMLVFFRCKKKSYYLITLVLVVAIWAVFKYGLGVRF